MMNCVETISSPSVFDKTRALQKDLRLFFHEIEVYISSSSSHSELSLCDYCKKKLEEYDITDTWYYDALVMVFSGERTKLSFSGSSYLPTYNLACPSSDILNVVVSPRKGQAMGAASKTFFLFDKKGDLRIKALYESIKVFQDNLHEKMVSFIKVDMSFNTIAEYCQREIVSAGYQNLDHRGTFGHIMVKDLGDRIFIESGESFCVKDGLLFCFETQLSMEDFPFGVRREDLFAFNNDSLLIL